MAGRSLWSVLMLAWLSAASPPLAQQDRGVAPLALAGPEQDEDSAVLRDGSADDADGDTGVPAATLSSVADSD